MFARKGVGGRAVALKYRKMGGTFKEGRCFSVREGSITVSIDRSWRESHAVATLADPRIPMRATVSGISKQVILVPLALLFDAWKAKAP